jgi:hypothetical protein
MSLKLNSSGGGSVTLQEPTTASNVTLNLPAADGTVNTSGAVNEVPAGSASAPSIYPTGDTNTGIFFPAADTIAFTEGGVEAARIDSSGNVIIGTTSAIAGARLSVQAGTNVVAIQCNNAGNGLVFTNTSGTAAYNPILFYNNGTTLSLAGFIQTSGTSTLYSTSSDYRLKENIAPMVGALDTVAQLKPVTYTWKIDGSDGQGFIAHELQAVVPECVTGEKDAVDADGNPVYQGIDTSFLVATLTAGLQEAVAMIEELKAKVAALEAQ